MTEDSSPDRTRTIDWLLVGTLATLPLIEVLFAVTGWAESLGRPTTPLLLALVVTVIWVTVVGVSGTARPIATLLLTGVAAALLSSAVTLVLPAAQRSDLARLLDVADVVGTVVVTSALFTVWGLAAGLLAALIQRLRARRAHAA